MADLSRRVMLSHTSVRKWANGASVASGERLKDFQLPQAGLSIGFSWTLTMKMQTLQVVFHGVLDEKEETLLSL